MIITDTVRDKGGNKVERGVGVMKDNEIQECGHGEGVDGDGNTTLPSDIIKSLTFRP